MPDKDQGESGGPSLELPSLFGRKKKAKSRTEADQPAPQPLGEAHREAAPEPTPEPAKQRTAPLPVTPAAAAPEPAPTGQMPATAPERVALPAPEPQPASSAPRRVRERRPLRAPSMSTAVASVVVGALVGGLGVLLTYLGLQGCEAVRGTDSCGGPGLLVLVAIVVVMVVAGGAVLRMLSVPDGGNISFLGVGILSVVVLMFLVDQLFEPWIVAGLPLLSAASFAVAHWVTTRFVEDL